MELLERNWIASVLKKTPKPKPPYPMLGEVCSLLADAFGTKKDTPVSAKKKLDRLARDGDYNWALRPKIVEEFLVKPLGKLDAEFAEFVGKFANHLLDEHVRLLLKVSLDAMSREEAAPILIEHMYAAGVAAFLIKLHEQFGGPGLGDFFRQNAEPVDVAFKWLEASLEFQVSATVFTDDKQERDDIGRWRRGDTIPDFFRSILPLERKISTKRPDLGPKARSFAIWLLTARALAWFDREARAANFGSLLDRVRRHILLNCPSLDIGKILSTVNSETGKQTPEVVLCGRSLINGLNPTRSKNAGEQATTFAELDRFAELLKKHDMDGRAGYMLDWCRGRWHILSRKEECALEFYESAVQRALYRIGLEQQTLLREALSLAAHLGKKPAVKRLAHFARALGLFQDVLPTVPEVHDVLSDEQVRKLALAFDVIFPFNARFPEAPLPQ